MTDSTSDDGRDDFIPQERLAGRSARSISKELRCTVGEVDASLDRTLPKIDNDARRRYVALDLSRLDELLKVFFARAIENVDAQAGLLVVKILERRALLLGLDSPQKLDIVQVQAQEQPSSFDKIRDAIMRVAERAPPAQREAINLIGKIGPERALELLKAGSGNGAAVPSDAVPPADDPEPT
jgi:hypothetical protein